MAFDIRRLTEADRLAAIEVITDSLIVEPMFTEIYRDVAQRHRAARVIMTDYVETAIPARSGWGYFEGKRLQGVAIWAAPGTYPARGRDQLGELPVLLRLLRINAKAALAMARLEFNAQSYFPSTRVWYLLALGVSPLAQGQGIGRALMEEMLHRADLARETCYLETGAPANIRFYERLGFHVVEEAAQLIPNGPTHWTMLRRPQPIERHSF